MHLSADVVRIGNKNFLPLAKYIGFQYSDVQWWEENGHFSHAVHRIRVGQVMGAMTTTKAISNLLGMIQYSIDDHYQMQVSWPHRGSCRSYKSRCGLGTGRQLICKKCFFFVFLLFVCLLTLSTHAWESCSSCPVSLSVMLWFWRLLTINRWFRYELIQKDDLGSFIVLLFFNLGLIVDKTWSFQLPSVTS